MRTTAQDRIIAPTRAVFAELSRHLDADLCLELWNGERIRFSSTARDDIRVIIASPSALQRLLRKPDMNTFAELYALGDLDVAGGTVIDLMRRFDHVQFRHLPAKVNKARLLKAALPILFARAPARQSGMDFAGDVAARPDQGRDDKALIHFHYDLSNAFYELFLDPEMVYSCAYFASPDDDLETAQRQKLDLICRKLRLQPGDRLFDPGCGWGGLICHAAQHYGAIAYGTTLASEQLAWCEAKIERLGLGDRVKVELRDCRTVTPEVPFDKIAQIEMIEHVGVDNHDAFYRNLGRILRPRGIYVGQASARRAAGADDRAFRKRSPYMAFIDRYIFPGGELDHIGMTCAALERAGFEVHDVEGMREHFQRTCEHWARQLDVRKDEGAALVGMPRTRIWLLYLSLCALSFERTTLNLFQIVATNRRPGASGIALDRSLIFR